MAVLRYTLLRLLIFVVVGALFWLIGFRDFALLFAAVFASGILSIFVLKSSRDDVSSALAGRISTINERRQRRVVAEDEWNDAERGAQPDSEAEDGTSRPSGGPSSDR